RDGDHARYAAVQGRLRERDVHRGRQRVTARAQNAERVLQGRRIVVKIGSALFIDQHSGRLDRSWLEALCADVASLRAAGKEVIIVSSGAVALGARELGLDPQRARLEDS